nr:hypothetical protein [Tanacetum cinerariifolium]
MADDVAATSAMTWQEGPTLPCGGSYPMRGFHVAVLTYYYTSGRKLQALSVRGSGVVGLGSKPMIGIKGGSRKGVRGKLELAQRVYGSWQILRMDPEASIGQ